MSLLNPSPGEILDRLSILALKIPAFEKKAIDHQHLEAEKNGLEEKMQEWDYEMRENMPANVTWDMIAQQKNALAAVNALLWKAEDEVRMTSEMDAMKLARLCKHIAAMNDGRARAIHEINEIYGVSNGQEKLYEHRSFVSDVNMEA